MNIGPALSVSASAAGAPLSQTGGAEAERTQKDSTAHSRRAEADAKAERAEGIGQTEQDQETSERDADGRRFWEAPTESATTEPTEPDSATPTPRQAKDPSGQSGNALDLTG